MALLEPPALQFPLNRSLPFPLPFKIVGVGAPKIDYCRAYWGPANDSLPHLEFPSGAISRTGVGAEPQRISRCPPTLLASPPPAGWDSRVGGDSREF